MLILRSIGVCHSQVVIPSKINIPYFANSDLNVEVVGVCDWPTCEKWIQAPRPWISYVYWSNFSEPVNPLKTRKRWQRFFYSMLPDLR